MQPLTAFHVLVCMILGLGTLRLVVAMRTPGDDRLRQLSSFAGGWLRARILGRPVSAIVVLWVVVCLAIAGVVEWLRLR